MQITLEHLCTLSKKYNIIPFTMGEFWGAFRAMNNLERTTNGEHMIWFELFLKHNLNKIQNK